MTLAMTQAPASYARFLFEFVSFNNLYVKGKSVANYWKAVKKNQKVLHKQEGCVFTDHALRITKMQLIFTEKVSQCKYRPGIYVTYGKIFRGHDGFYQVNYQYIKKDKDEISQTPYKPAIRSARLVSYQRF